MISEKAVKCLIFNEFDGLKKEEFFSYTKNKFITNIDTLYYSIYFSLQDDFYTSFEKMISYLENVKENYSQLRDEIKEIKIFDDLVYRGKCFGQYSVGFEVDRKFVAFFMRSVTPNTPQVIVQLRAEYLWQNDYKYCIDDSLDKICSFLSFYNIMIDNVVENRLDIAYHTNYISNIDKFFDSDMLGPKLVSHFKRWSKEGVFQDGDLICDYISFGRRKSNDVFVRIYNKVQEILNLKHKAYFLNLWLENGLITKFDYWVFERAFVDSSYQKIDYYRLLFYFNFGIDSFKKNQVFQVLSNFDNVDKAKVRKLADELVPATTLVVNFEFQLKRKFLSSLKLDFITNYVSVLSRIYTVLDNINNIHHYITHNVVRFVDSKVFTRKKNCPNLLWWDLLKKSVKINDFKLSRVHEVNLEKNVLKSKIIKNIASYCAYSGDVEKSILSSVESIINDMNENDLDKFDDYRKKRFAQVKDYIIKEL